eukprot:363324-Chlamydomonas_euryale.AAC.21
MHRCGGCGWTCMRAQDGRLLFLAACGELSEACDPCLGVGWGLVVWLFGCLVPGALDVRLSGGFVQMSECLRKG